MKLTILAISELQILITERCDYMEQMTDKYIHICMSAQQSHHESVQ